MLEVNGTLDVIGVFVEAYVKSRSSCIFIINKDCLTTQVNEGLSSADFDLKVELIFLSCLGLSENPQVDVLVGGI